MQERDNVHAHPSASSKIQPRGRVLQPVATTAILVTALLAPSKAHAYRPFDSTDAAVARSGELEIEYGPFGYVGSAAKRTLVTPSLIVNVGLLTNWELVLQTRQFIQLDHDASSARAHLAESAALLKGILREGVLQGRTGWSMGTEFGALLPNANGERGIGATDSLILSQRWPAMTLHVNGALSLTRAGNWDLLAGTILEGPYGWRLRPVAELFIEREFAVGTTRSALVGSIWNLADALSLDWGLRMFSITHQQLYEIRGGLTWTFPTMRQL